MLHIWKRHICKFLIYDVSKSGSHEKIKTKYTKPIFSFHYSDNIHDPDSGSCHISKTYKYASSKYVTWINRPIHFLIRLQFCKTTSHANDFGHHVPYLCVVNFIRGLRNKVTLWLVKLFARIRLLLGKSHRTYLLISL